MNRDYIGKVIAPSCACVCVCVGESLGCCVFPRVKLFHLFLQTESCNSFSQPESQDIFCGDEGVGTEAFLVNNVCLEKFDLFLVNFLFPGPHLANLLKNLVCSRTNLKGLIHLILIKFICETISVLFMNIRPSFFIFLIYEICRS